MESGNRRDQNEHYPNKRHTRRYSGFRWRRLFSGRKRLYARQRVRQPPQGVVLQPVEQIALTKKGEVYAAAHDFADWRRAIEDEIERLVSILDDFDGDSDLEPSLADAGYLGVTDDREGDELDRGELDECDLEPTMGWTHEEARSGAYASTHDTDECEAEDDKCITDDPHDSGDDDEMNGCHRFGNFIPGGGSGI